MPRTASAVMIRGDGFPGIAAVVMQTSLAGDGAGHQLALLLIKLLAQLLGVAAGGFGAGRFQRHFDELRAEAFDLLLHGGPHVVRLHDRAEPPRRGDRLQPGDAGADHEHLGRRERAGRRHHQRKHFRQTVGRQRARPCSRRSWPSTRARPCSEPA